MTTVCTTRNRAYYLLLCFLVIASGLASRRYGALLPHFVAEYAGDALWALLMFLAFGFLLPKESPLRVAVLALVFSYAVEVSQLYHAPWIEALRHTRLGGLVLGYGFLWSDIACYTFGVTAGFTLETLFRRLQ